MRTSILSARTYSSFLVAGLLLALPVAAAAQPALALRTVPTTERTAAPSLAEWQADQADLVLETLWTDPAFAATLTPQPERSTRDFARFALAVTTEQGSYLGHTLHGTADGEHGRTYRYAEVHFQHATVPVRLTWSGRRLVTVTRAPSAVARR